MKFSTLKLKFLLIAICTLPGWSLLAQPCAMPQGNCDDVAQMFSLANVNYSGSLSLCADSSGAAYQVNDTIYMAPGQAYQSIVTIAVYLDTRIRAWVDWNGDDTFAPEELVDYATGTVSGTHAGVFAVDPTLPETTTRLRLMLYLVGDVVDPCTGGTVFGAYQTLDFPVRITAAKPPKSPYCAATGDCGGANGYHISRFEITGENSTSINNASGCNGYADYSNLKVTVNGGVNYSAKITARQNIYYSVASIFVDWDDDGLFEDSEEYRGVKDQAATYFTVTILTPDSFPSGLKRARLRNTLLLEEPNPCGFQANGEVEDYTFLYMNPDAPLPPCAAQSSKLPANNATDICQNTTLSWGAVTGVNGYKVTVYQGTTVVKQATVTTTSLPVGPLDPATTYRWTVTPFNANGGAIGCDTLSFTTGSTPDPTVAVIPGDPISACAFQPLQLIGNPSGGTQPFSHAWSGTASSSLSANDIYNPVFTSGTGQFSLTYTVTDSKGCKATTTVSLVVNPSPQISGIQAFKNDFCAGDSTGMSVNGSAGAVISWEDSTSTHVMRPTTVYGTGPNYITPALNETTWYRATATFPSTGCAASSMVELRVNPKPDVPQVSVTPGTNPCEGEVVTLLAGTLDDVVWDDALQTADQLLTIAESGTYTATITNSYNCVSRTAPTTITFRPAPEQPQIVSSGTPCEGGTVTLSINSSNSAVWDDPLSTTGNTLQVYNDGVFTVTVTNAEGCSASASYSATFNPVPDKPSVVVNGSSPICEGDPIVLESSYPNGNTWSTGSSNSQITVLTDGSYSVIYTDNNGCSSASDPVDIDFLPTPDTPTVIETGNTLTSSVTGASYQWYDENGPIAGATGQTYDPLTDGDYRVVVISADGCPSQPSPQYSFVGINEVRFAHVQLFPNPAHDRLFIKGISHDAVLKVFNSLGQEVGQGGVEPGGSLNIRDLRPGAYYVRVTWHEGEIIRPLIVE